MNDEEFLFSVRPSKETKKFANVPDFPQKEEENPASFGMRLRLQKDPGIFFGTAKKEDDPRVYLGKHPSSFYVGKPQSIDGHCAVFGSSGSGKGSCIAIPTMVSWGDSPMVVLDPKGDLYEQYLRIRTPEKRPAKLFNPAKDDTCAYDPLAHIRNDDDSNRVANVRELVNAIIPKPLDSHDRFWVTAAQKILTGAFLYYLDLSEDDTNPENKLNFYDIIDCITSLPLKKLFKQIAGNMNEDEDFEDEENGDGENTAAIKYIRSFLGKSDLSDSEMLMDINETLDTYLMDFINDMRIRNALSPSENVINWEKDLDEYNIFLSIPEDKIDQWGSLLNVLITQLIRTLERRPERYTPQGAKLKPVLLLLDEFPAIGRIDVLANALSMLRSKNVTILLIAQSISQLDAIYGRDGRNIMLENCDFQAVLRVNCADSQKYFSELAGTVPALLRSASCQYSRGKSHLKFSGYSESTSETFQPFIRPEELAHLNNELILFTPYATFYVKKHPFFNWESDIFTPFPEPQAQEDLCCVETESTEKIPPDAVKCGNFTFRNMKKESD